jgi:hypothetical protein
MNFIERTYYGSRDIQNIDTGKNIISYSSKNFISEYIEESKLYKVECHSGDLLEELELI